MSVYWDPCAKGYASSIGGRRRGGVYQMNPGCHYSHLRAQRMGCLRIVERQARSRVDPFGDTHVKPLEGVATWLGGPWPGLSRVLGKLLANVPVR